GCCVGEGFSSAVEYLQCVEIALGGEPDLFEPICSEAVYALSRVEIGGGKLMGDGSVGAWAARAVRQDGGLPRWTIGAYDLASFNPARAREWGRHGLPDNREPDARLHPVQTVSLVRSFAEARAAIAHGYPRSSAMATDFAGRKADGATACVSLA